VSPFLTSSRRLMALGVVSKKGARVREADGACAANKERLAEGILEFANRQTDGRLSAIEPLGRAGEAAFLGDHEKDLEFTEVHTFLLTLAPRPTTELQKRSCFRG